MPIPGRTRGALLLAVSAMALALLSPSPAGADVGTKIIERCAHGQSIAGFTQQDYRRALQETTAEVNEYSECVNLIHKALLAAAGRGSSGGAGTAGSIGGGGGSSALTANVAPPTPAEQQALQAAHSHGGAPVTVGGENIAPGVVHADIASAVSSLPTPLLALLALLTAGALSILARAVREQVRSRRPS